jgi:cohesin complex subunit SA-1/2
MDVLPRLFTKHQADSDRMSCLLLIPEQMTLSLYQDMRKGAVSAAIQPAPVFS